MSRLDHQKETSKYRWT